MLAADGGAQQHLAPSPSRNTLGHANPRAANHKPPTAEEDHEEERKAAVRVQAMARGTIVRSRGGRGWGRARKAVGRMVRMGGLLKSMRISRMSELAMLNTPGGVTTQVHSREELASLRIWEQGDANLYTRSNLERRYANRTHGEVFRYLNKWWASAMASAGLRPDAAHMPKHVYVELYVRVCFLPTRPPTLRTTLPASYLAYTYLLLTYTLRILPTSLDELQVCKALLEDDEQWDEAEAYRLVEGAWREDTRGTGSMSATMFNDALFELADVWTETVHADEYVELLGPPPPWTLPHGPP